MPRRARIAHDLDCVVKSELLKEVRAMGLEGGGTNRQQLRHFLAATTFRDQLQDLTFALRQRVIRIADAPVESSVACSRRTPPAQPPG